MRINISIDDKLLQAFDSFCEKYRFNRSELLSKLMREQVYTHFTQPKTKENGKLENREVSTDDVSTVVMQREVSQDEKELLKQEKIKKAREAIKNMEKNSKAPTFCPKHGTMRVGDHYTCGCLI